MKDLPEKGFPQPEFKLRVGLLEVIFGRTKEYTAKKAGLKDVESLSEEEKQVYLYIQKQGDVARGEVVTEFGFNDKTAQRRLAMLIEKNLIIMTGNRKGARYKAVK